MRTQEDGAADDMVEKLLLAAELVADHQPRLRETLIAAAQLLEILDQDITATEDETTRLERIVGDLRQGAGAVSDTFWRDPGLSKADAPTP